MPSAGVQGGNSMSWRWLSFKGGKGPTYLLKTESQTLSKAGYSCSQNFSLAKNSILLFPLVYLAPFEEHSTSNNPRREGVDFASIIPHCVAKESFLPGSLSCTSSSSPVKHDVAFAGSRTIGRCQHPFGHVSSRRGKRNGSQMGDITQSSH